MKPRAGATRRILLALDGRPLLWPTLLDLSAGQALPEAQVNLPPAGIQADA